MGVSTSLPPPPLSSSSYQAVDGVDGWGEGPGMGQRLSADEVRMQQQAIIAGEKHWIINLNSQKNFRLVVSVVYENILQIYCRKG